VQTPFGGGKERKKESELETGGRTSAKERTLHKNTLFVDWRSKLERVRKKGRGKIRCKGRVLVHGGKGRGEKLVGIERKRKKELATGGARKVKKIQESSYLQLA